MKRLDGRSKIWSGASRKSIKTVGEGKLHEYYITAVDNCGCQNSADGSKSK
jgi:hypothetical protein